jgi:hypothetical protein
MCGRQWRELVTLYRLTQPAIKPRLRYNIAPPAMWRCRILHRRETIRHD